ncbi:hypothetical protein KL949_001908 [Ogataea haglerorum]|nr:hypothetical protein KL913_002232 [Ogataea haglerorum]KAG7719943.1 hypothetical protein KL949_001908 [Ogataea haglerorum]KAG7768398.1 hypothetical protein KL931_003004 [Ogataea haglerorum]
MLNKFGGVISGAVVFAMNYSGTKKGQVSLNTYIALISIQCTGPFFALLLSPPEKVIRKDNTCVETNVVKDSLRKMCKRYLGLLRRKEITLLLPILGFIVQRHLADSTSTLDWATGRYYYDAYVPMQVFKIPTEFVFNWVFWVVSVQEFSSKENAYISGLIRAVESFGSMLSFLVGVANGNDMVNLSVAAAVFWAAVPSVTYLVLRVLKITHTNPESVVVQKKKSGDLVEITEEIE